MLVNNRLPIASAMRVQGNQIGRQRQVLFDYWMDKTDFEWMFWIDSDIHMTEEAAYKVWSACDAKERPVVTGVYFISKENEGSVMTPYPAAFHFTDDEHKIQYLHPLPKDALVKTGCAGFGFVIMHRSVGEKMRKHHAPRNVFFNETGAGEQFISEDIHFFRAMADAGIPMYTHTGALVKHMKRFALDVEYYKLYWNSKANEANQGS